MKFLIALVGILISSSASADYFKLGVGYSAGGEAKFEDSTGDTTRDLDSAFLAPILLAYGFEIMGDVHGEVEFAYRITEYDVSGAQNEPSAITGAFNVVGNAPLGAVTLTGGAGAIFGSFDSDLTGADAGTAFGVQIFGGLDFPINDSVAVGGEVRYMTTLSKADIGNDTDLSYNNMSVLFNVKFGM